MASWLVRWTPKPEDRIRAKASDIVLCYRAGHFTLTVSLSTHAGAQMDTGKFNARVNPAID